MSDQLPPAVVAPGGMTGVLLAKSTESAGEEIAALEALGSYGFPRPSSDAELGVMLTGDPVYPGSASVPRTTTGPASTLHRRRRRCC